MIDLHSPIVSSADPGAFRRQSNAPNGSAGPRTRFAIAVYSPQDGARTDAASGYTFNRNPPAELCFGHADQAWCNSFSIDSVFAHSLSMARPMDNAGRALYDRTNVHNGIDSNGEQRRPSFPICLSRRELQPDEHTQRIPSRG
jgi:hypothetical protein